MPAISNFVFKSSIFALIPSSLPNMNYKLILALLGIIGMSRAQNLIDTTYGEGAGSFELPGFATADGYITLSDGSTAITGWTVDPVAVDWVTPVYWNPSDGRFSLDLNGFFVAGGILTTVPTIPGTSYAVSFDLAGFVAPGSPSNPKSVEVSVGTSTKSFSLPVPTVTGQKPITVNWTQHKFEFVASSVSSTLSFKSLVPGDASGLLLDNVSVQKVATMSVTNVRGEQRLNTDLVDVYYDLVASNSSSVSVRLQVSPDSGHTWSVPVVNVSQDVGANVISGHGKHILWNAGADWNGQVSKNVKFKVIASGESPESDGFALIPAGSFQMGDALADGNADELPVHTVQVSAFYMAQYEVTKSLWDEVRIWGLSHGYTDLGAGAGKALDHPVNSISWYDMVKWCNGRSEKEELNPCYTVLHEVYRTGDTSPDCNFEANGYRLPTEAEWEKAARGGITGKRFPWGDTISHSDANFTNDGGESYQSGSIGSDPIWSGNDESYPYTSPVGSFSVNGYGLYDMIGNVWEWCWDTYDSNYYTYSPEIDPQGATIGAFRVFRGGGWNDLAYYSRVSTRGRHYPFARNSNYGFRLARSSVH